LCGATVAADDEEFLERVSALAFRVFNLKELVRVVHIACSLDLVRA